MNRFENFQKFVDTNLNVEFDSDVNIELDIDKDVDINSDSLVNVTGNFGSLTFDVTAAGDNGFAEASVSVFVGDNLVESSGSLVAGVDDFGRPIPDDDDDIPINEFDIDDFNDDVEGTIGEKDIYNFNILSPNFDNTGQLDIIGFEPGVDEIRFNFNMEATRYVVENGGFGPFGEMFVNDEIFFGGEISGGFKKDVNGSVELILPGVSAEDQIGTVFEMGTDIPFADVTYTPSPSDFAGGTILIESLTAALEPDDLVFLNEM